MTFSPLFSPFRSSGPGGSGAPATPVPLGEEEIARLTRYGEDVLARLRQRDPQAGFNARGVDALSRIIDQDRSHYSPEQRIQMANALGAFLALAIRATLPGPLHWLRIQGDIALGDPAQPSPRYLYPITQVYQHIDQGDPASIGRFFATLHPAVGSPPPQGGRQGGNLGGSILPAEPPPVTAADPARIPLDDARLHALQPELYADTLWAHLMHEPVRDTQAIRTQWRARIAEHLLQGEARAALVVDPEQGLVAAYAGILDCVALLRFNRDVAVAEKWQRGTRLLTVNLYQPLAQGKAEDLDFGPRATHQYGNFHPLIANLLSTDLTRLSTRIQRLPEAEWERLTQALRRATAGRHTPRDGRPVLAAVPGRAA